jgi:hypothetical protein
MDMQPLTIQGQQFNIPMPFSAGHVLEASEASAMNQLYAENIRNNFAGKMKKAEEAKETVPGQAELDAYCQTYKFGAKGISGPKLDPVEAEARRLAKTAITEALKAKGYKLKDVPDEQLNAWVLEAVESTPQFRTTAQTLISQRQAALQALQSAGLNIGTPAGGNSAQQPAPQA